MCRYACVSLTVLIVRNEEYLAVSNAGTIYDTLFGDWPHAQCCARISLET